MASFSVDEMEFIKCRGNDVCMSVIVLYYFFKLDISVSCVSMSTTYIAP